MLTTIKVEQRHIDAGKRRLCEKCPIALAVNEHLKDGLSAYVCQGEPSRVSIGRYHWAAYLHVIKVYDKNVYTFIVDFDHEVHEVKPFEFQLDIPEEYLKG